MNTMPVAFSLRWPWDFDWTRVNWNVVGEFAGWPFIRGFLHILVNLLPFIVWILAMLRLHGRVNKVFPIIACLFLPILIEFSQIVTCTGEISFSDSFWGFFALPFALLLEFFFKRASLKRNNVLFGTAVIVTVIVGVWAVGATVFCYCEYGTNYFIQFGQAWIEGIK